MFKISLEHEGRTLVNATIEHAAEMGVPKARINAAAKMAAKKEIAAFVDAYRTKLATGSPGKLAEYRIKEEIARSPDIASQAELDLLSREAKARDTDRTGLLGDIAQKAAAYRQIALLIGALGAETNAAISVIPDDAADIETQIQTVLEAAKAQAETAFVEALALINGGS